ncbi:hypothetical protein JKP88DRAFT_173432, partial [Tribonema minus]
MGDLHRQIGERLSEGWAMLSQHCPQCSTVLLRSRDQQIFCVSCQCYCLTEEQ